MILGVGLDVVDVAGFEAQLADPASRFAAGTFTAGERQAAASRASGAPGRHLAARFAAKEAFIKAWSSANLGRAPAIAVADLREIEVVQDAFGRPSIALSGRVAEATALLGPLRIHASLSHDGGLAVAVVVLERQQTILDQESWT